MFVVGNRVVVTDTADVANCGRVGTISWLAEVHGYFYAVMLYGNTSVRYFTAEQLALTEPAAPSPAVYWKLEKFGPFRDEPGELLISGPVDFLLRIAAGLPR